ncbi:MAG: DUF302 domain-containing protein [Hydrogenovibrio sp.]|uniref:DUF302 domain-containing protein n=1 Tax=Hydrogenovibrio sp. TaxID=2065821 RepID=UPI0028701A1C|nr:DUF302 domain-containing protein [Hydrogenovibrio sp.]MDR9498897.1 DUF302 domain-containing protein [Hydrogenovibrio sp.]
MFYQLDSDKSFEQAVSDLEAAVKNHGFGVLHIHDLGSTLRSKGQAFQEECKVLEVCQPAQAARALKIDMRLNMALPCRISVYTENGQTKIGMVSPVKMLGMLSQDTELAPVASEVEQKTIEMINEAK